MKNNGIKWIALALIICTAIYVTGSADWLWLFLIIVFFI